MIIDWWRTICELLSIFKLCTWTYVILYTTSIAKKFIVMFWNFHSFYLSLCPFTGSKYASWISDVSYHGMEQNVCALFTPISVSLFANLHDSLTLGRLWLQSHSSTAESVHLFGVPIKKIMTNNLFSTFVKWKNLTSLLWLYSSASTNILCNSSEWHGDLWSGVCPPNALNAIHNILFYSGKKELLSYANVNARHDFATQVYTHVGSSTLIPYFEASICLVFLVDGLPSLLFVIEGFLLFWGIHISFQQSVFIIIMDSS